MTATKATWKVTAGIILGQPMDEYAKVFEYTSDMYAKDDALDIYNAMLDQAHSYARSLSDPRLLNWVNVEFVWY